MTSTNQPKKSPVVVATSAGLFVALGYCESASAQNSRIFERPQARPMLNVNRTRQMDDTYPPDMVPPDILPSTPQTLNDGSWISIPLPPPKEIKKHDHVTIRVDIVARTQQESELQRRRNSTYDALLRSWVVLEGLTQIRKAPQTDGQQRVQGQLNGQLRTEGDLLTSESMKFDIAAKVVDILPNGNLVLEARRTVHHNEETWIVALTGICSRDAIGPGNLVLSKDIADLEVTKEEEGHIRDTYKRGWIQRWWDRIKAF